MLADFRFHLNIGNWLWHPLRSVTGRQVVPVTILLGLWQTANLAGFLWERARRNASTLRDGAPALSR